VSPDTRRALGDAGEHAVARWYEQRGYRVVDRNWHCREGELDIVAARAAEVVFCEVKTRRSTAYGAPMEAVTAAKQRKLRTLALRWLAEHPERTTRDLRFDVASVLAPRDAPMQIDVIEGAF
jgi:putative endonuclease